MRQAFPDCLRFVLERDPQLSTEAAAPSAQTARLFRDKFWTPLRCDDLWPGIDLMVFDHAVVDGPAAATLCLQSAAGYVDPAGMTEQALFYVKAACTSLGAIRMIASLKTGRLGAAAEAGSTANPQIGTRFARAISAADEALVLFRMHVGADIPKRQRTK